MDEWTLRNKVLALSPQKLVSYLRERGWDTIEDAWERWIALRYEGDGRYHGATVRVPLRKSFRDYGMRMTEALEAVATIESRNVEAVIDGVAALMAAVIPSGAGHAMGDRRRPGERSAADPQ